MVGDSTIALKNKAHVSQISSTSETTGAIITIVKGFMKMVRSIKLCITKIEEVYNVEPLLR